MVLFFLVLIIYDVSYDKYDMNNDQYVILSTHLDKEITDSHPSLCLHDLVDHRGDDVVNVTCTLL